MITLIGLLVWEYQFLKKETDTMRALQKEYYSYIALFKQTNKDDGTTKKIAESLFPRGARVFSSDEDICTQDSLVLLDRSNKHLQHSALAYYKEQRTQLPDTYNRNCKQTLSIDKSIVKKQSSIPKKKRTKTTAHKKYSRWTLVNKSPTHNEKTFFSWPIAQESFWLSSFFGPRRKPNGSWGFHYGVDMAALKGTPVHAAANGVIIEARHTSGYGNTIVILHNNRYKTRYAHLEKITVKQNKSVVKGDIIGTVGATGFTIKSGNDASHLHFEVYDNGKQVNPLYLLST
jgi:murein DD-endopeptidase MepM/ murein hydrolase activator NlpD